MQVSIVIHKGSGFSFCEILVPALEGCISSGNSLEDALDNVKRAIISSYSAISNKNIPLDNLSKELKIEDFSHLRNPFITKIEVEIPEEISKDSNGDYCCKYCGGKEFSSPYSGRIIYESKNKKLVYGFDVLEEERRIKLYCTNCDSRLYFKQEDIK